MLPRHHGAKLDCVEQGCPLLLLRDLGELLGEVQIILTDDAILDESFTTLVENLLLACRAEGLGCPLTTLLCEREPAVRELLAIPQPWGTAAAIPIGYLMLRGHGPISRRPVEELTFVDAWGKSLSA